MAVTKAAAKLRPTVQPASEWKRPTETDEQQYKIKKVTDKDHKQTKATANERMFYH